ncbi:winged helix-turn-helix transcriptional regulator [Paenibacillus harenae]|uniref:winged helix-turn-helix transcriptional regulator n=1 Tax=Paenibacillus harenae TaxID=306543 RepID=UPI003593122B
MVYQAVPHKAKYPLTEYGSTLEAILTLMHQWGSAHLDYMRIKSEQPFRKGQNLQQDT